MSSELTVTLVSVFLSTALLVGLFASTVLGRTAPELKRLRDVTRLSVETEGAFYCCAHCARKAGEKGAKDRVDAINAELSVTEKV